MTSSVIYPVHNLLIRPTISMVKAMKAMAKAVKGMATKKGMAAMKATAKKEKPAKPYVEPKGKKGN